MGTFLHLLSADVITRYLRLAGEEVIAVTGSDAHGTPIQIAAAKAGVSPNQFAADQHHQLVQLLDEWSISFDNYTITTTKQHQHFVQEFYRDLRKQGIIEKQDIDQFYCDHCSKFLPDRFVVGICPYCQTSQARGDQCSNDNCNLPLTPFEIVDPRCSQCDRHPKKRQTSHWYFKLAEFETYLEDFLNSGLKIPATFRSEALAFVKRGLKHRALTRDLDWGIPADEVFESEENKVFYVWAEDVLGYISASIPILERAGEDWRKVWSRANTVYCLGKDNLFFHAIWYPALLQASSVEYAEPSVLSITNFIQFNGQGFSKSKGIGIWADEVTEYAPPDYWRFYLIYTRPERKDSNFTWDDFVGTVNKHLANTIGNVVLRVLTLIQKFQDSRVVSVQVDHQSNKQFLAVVDDYEHQLKNSVYDFELGRLLRLTLELAQSINLHVERTRPWNIANERHRQEVLWVCFQALNKLATWLEPIIPSIAAQLRHQLAYDETFHLPQLTFFIKKLPPIGTSSP